MAKSKILHSSDPSIVAKEDKYRELRERIETELTLAGFILNNGSLELPIGDPKTVYRNLHMEQRRERIESSRKVIEKWESHFLKSSATPSEIDIEKIKPRIRTIETPEDRGLFNYASLTWSVPISKGFGRRSYFLVEDEQNDKLIGIFALGDPVYNLSVRDNYIGWSQEQKKLRLYNVFDAFICGAIDPYRHLLAGKLVAMLTATNEVSEFLRQKYDGKVTYISEVVKDSRPALITVTSALGRSSVYNRLKLESRFLLKSQGYTKGFGHFHFSPSLYVDLLEVAKEHPNYSGTGFGDGANWKIRTLRQALTLIGSSNSYMQHGLSREVFLGELAPTSLQFLRGETETLDYYQTSVEEVSKFWLDRWLKSRPTAVQAMKEFDLESVKLSAQLADGVNPTIF